jgi:signal peptidase I
VFRHPTQGVDFIKRLVGLPGDTIQVTNGVLIINGTPVQVKDDGTFVETKEKQGPQGLMPRCANDPVGQGGDCVKGRQIETLPNGVSHDILNISDTWVADNTPVFTVPAGQYFFMGDNRDNSADSRFAVTADGVGFVPAEYLIGRADRIMFSSAGRSLLYFWTWRSDRFFKAVE